MILEKIKEYILSNKGIIHKFIFHGTRNQDDVFYGKILELYPRIFTIMLFDGSIRSYSFSDVLISSLEIIE